MAIYSAQIGQRLNTRHAGHAVAAFETEDLKELEAQALHVVIILDRLLLLPLPIDDDLQPAPLSPTCDFPTVRGSSCLGRWGAWYCRGLGNIMAPNLLCTKHKQLLGMPTTLKPEHRPP